MNGEVRQHTAIGSISACLAAFAVGVVFARWGLSTIAQYTVVELVAEQNLSGVLAPVVLAVAAALTVPATRLLPAHVALNGWAAAAPGLLVVLAAMQLAAGPSATLSKTATPLLVVAGAGVALAGALVGVGALSGGPRLTAAAALAAGITLAWPVDQLTRPERYEPGTFSPYLVLPAAALAVVVAAAVFGTVRHTPPAAEPAVPATPPAAGPKAWGAVVAVLSAAVVLVAGRAALRAAVEGLRLSRDGLASERRIEFVQDLGRYGAVAVAVAVALVLTVYAYRRGRAGLARWTVLCLALTPSLIIGVHTYAVPRFPLGAELLALVGLVCGGLAVRYADRWLPWDAFGVSVAACGVAVGAVAYRQGPAWMEAASLLTAAGLGFALSAGLVGVLRTATGRAVETAESLLLGFATLVLVTPALAPLVVETTMSSGYGETPVLLPVLMVGAALVLLALFGFGRAVDRVRRDIRAQATAEQP